ncbi:MAG: hypothetical protein ACUVRV_07500 [Cyanobacteriota bacterium]
METVESAATSSAATSVATSTIRLQAWAELPTRSLQEFEQQVEQAWQVCDRFELQTEIWRGRILQIVRDREKQRGIDGAVAFSIGSKSGKSAKVALMHC